MRIFRIYLQNNVSLKRAHQFKINAKNYFKLHGRQILKIKTKTSETKICMGLIKDLK